MTNKQLQEIKERHARAVESTGLTFYEAVAREDFQAMAYTDIPVLVAEVEKLNEELNLAYSKLDRNLRNCPDECPFYSPRFSHPEDCGDICIYEGDCPYSWRNFIEYELKENL